MLLVITGNKIGLIHGKPKSYTISKFILIDKYNLWDVIEILKICETCKKEYKTSNSKSRFCSKNCFSKSRTKRITYNCEYCNKPHTVIECVYNKANHHFCSRSCKGKWQSEHIKGLNHHLNKKVYVSCSICGEKLFRLVENDNSKFYCSEKCKSIGNSKELSPRWNNELDELDRVMKRNYKEYDDWRKSVFERDSYTCVICKDNVGGNLNAHHINSYHSDKELRLEIENGVTLCTVCHKLFHKKFGYKNNNKEQFSIFYKDMAIMSEVSNESSETCND